MLKTRLKSHFARASAISFLQVTIILAIGGGWAHSPSGWAAAENEPLLTGFYARLQDNQAVELKQFQNKVVLVVNTASRCGYTPQYEGLETLYSKYRDEGMVILGFPSGSFNQEYQEDEAIADLCYNTFGVQFPMFAPVDVTGEDAAPLFQALRARTNKPVRWNFNKYLISKDGREVQHFPSSTEPLNSVLETEIQKALAR